MLLISDASTPADELSSYSVAISSPSGSGISFTGADTNTGYTYIFDPDNSGGFTLLDNTLDPNSANITDFAADLDQTISPSMTYGLGEFYFSVDANALPGMDPVTFSATSSLSGALATDFDNLTDVTYVGGQITVLSPPPPSPTVTPEPSTIVMLGVSLAMAGSTWLRKRRWAGIPARGGS